MNLPLVSVIIPVFNSAPFVSRAIASVLNQTYTNLEIMLVDNDSTDNSMGILKDFQARFPEKITLYREMTPGAPAARNKGLMHAKGEWLQFLDADDVLLPHKIERQVVLAKKTRSDIVAGGYKFHRPLYNRRIKTCLDPWEGLIASRLGKTSSILWRKIMLDRIGGWNESLPSSQEYNLLFEILKRNPDVCVDDTMNTIVNQRTQSVSKPAEQNRLYEVLSNRIELRKQIEHYLSDNNLFNRERQNVYERYLYSQVILQKYACPAFYSKYRHVISRNIPPTYRIKRHAEAVIKEGIRKLTGINLS